MGGGVGWGAVGMDLAPEFPRVTPVSPVQGNWVRLAQAPQAGGGGKREVRSSSTKSSCRPIVGQFLALPEASCLENGDSTQPVG